MKVLVVIPSSMSMDDAPRNGLLVAARDLTVQMAEDHGVEFTMIGDVAEDKSYHALKINTSMRNHQVNLTRELEKVIDQYDLIHFHSTFYLAARCAFPLSVKYPKKPIIVTMHSSFAAGITANQCRDYLDGYETAYVNYPDGHVHAEFEKYYGRSTSRYWTFSNLIRGLQPSLKPKLDQVAVVSRLDAEKNPVGSLTKAIRDAREHNHKVVFVCDLSSQLAPTKATLAMEKELLDLLAANQDIVHHRSHMTRPEIRELVASSRVVYQLSVSECQSLVPMEANALGCAFVGYKDVNPHVDYEGNHLIVKKDKIAFATNHLSKVLQVDPRQVLIDNYTQRFDPQKVSSDWVSFYESVIRTHKPNFGL